MSGRDDFAALADGVFDAVKQYVATERKRDNDAAEERYAELRAHFEDLREAYLVLQQRIATIPAGPAGENGKDGADGKDGAPGPQGARGLPGEPGRDGLEGKDGAPGRDGLQVNVLDAIDPTRCYPRGTYACYKGGTVRAVRTTDPIDGKDLESAGWQIVCNGIAELLEDVVTTTDGKSMRIRWAFQGPFEATKEYQRGDTVLFRNSSWFCNAATSNPPGDPADRSWSMMAKGAKYDPQAHYLGPVPKGKA